MTDADETAAPRQLRNEYAGTEAPTEASVVRVTYSSLSRGEITRYLERGEMINLPADRVEVEVLADD